MTLKSTLLAFAALLLLSNAAAAADAGKTDVTGLWVTGDGKAHVQIQACGKDVCGTVVWLAVPINSDTGLPKLDGHNPDEALRSRPILGLQMFDLKPDTDSPDPNSQWKGEIYNPEDGNTYDATLKSAGEKIDLQGCVFFGLLCKTDIWTRFN